ncbi:MAG: hypothetical protein IJL83_07145 [Clostridia bacterium]|nr:hypothetical protein [Clostridia bacterium]
MSDKVFTKKMTLSICLIILCLCALSISAGAFFSDTSKSNAKTFSTATYDLTITATKQVTENSTTTTESVTATAADPHIYEFTILPDADKAEGYSVRLQIKTGITATSSGYCKIVIKDKETPTTVLGTYYSKQIAKANAANADITTLRDIKIITEKAIIVEFIPLWGTYSGNDALANNKIINVAAAGTITLSDPPSTNT